MPIRQLVAAVLFAGFVMALFLAGLALFVAASVACAAAPGLDALVAAQTAQGVGAALLPAASLPPMAANG